MESRCAARAEWSARPRSLAPSHALQIPHAPWRAPEGLEGDRERARRARRRAREKLGRMFFWQRFGKKARGLREQAKTPRVREGEGEEGEAHKGDAADGEGGDEEEHKFSSNGMRQHSRNLADAILRKVHRSVAEAEEPLHHLAVLDVDPEEEEAVQAAGHSWLASKSKRLTSIKRGSLAEAAREGREERGKTPESGGEEEESPTPAKAVRKQKRNTRMETPL